MCDFCVKERHIMEANKTRRKHDEEKLSILNENNKSKMITTEMNF